MLLKGAKGSPKVTADNLFSTDTVEVLFGVGEGPIKGLVDGPKNFFVGDTTLMSQSGEDNFEEFELIVRNGSEIGTDIKSRMGGFGTSTNVTTNLEHDIPVVRSGTHTGVDYIDIRLLINQLQRSDSGGTFQHTGRVKIEFKDSASSTWTPIKSVEVIPVPTQIEVDGGTAYYSSGTNSSKTYAAVGDSYCFLGNDPPSTTGYVSGERWFWFDANDNYQPYTVNLSLPSHWEACDAVFTAAHYHNPPSSGKFYPDCWVWSGHRVWIGEKSASTAKKGDFWIKPSTGVVKLYNGQSYSGAGTSLSLIWASILDLGNMVNGEISITGKTTSAFVKELRIPVPRSASLTYDLRVTRTSPANDASHFFDVQWESFQEITAQVFNFPGLATTQLTARASDQFASIPELSGIYDGRIVKVPSNYDPVARTYTGVWDGLWKLEYTNNVAYVGADLIDNDRYGLNAYYPVTVNKYDIYDAGQWCDVITADGTPRFTFNGIISAPTNAREAIDYVFGIMGARFFDDGNGTGVIRIDNDSNAVMIFSPENVEGGTFSYSQYPLSARYNDVTVTFINPDLNWAEDRRRIFDQANIDLVGRNPTTMVAVGCTNIPEAIRRGRYKVITSLTEKTMVAFSTNRVGLYLQPYDIILIADDELGYGLHGRAKSVTGNTITLRDQIYLEVGVSYQISFTQVNVTTGEFEVGTYNLAAGQTGLRSTLTVSGSLPGEVVADTVFTLSSVGGANAPRPFRVVDLDNDDADSEVVKITAVEVNRAKWAYIDGLVTDIISNPTYDMKVNEVALPVAGITVDSENIKSGAKVSVNLTISWEPSPSKAITSYVVSVSANGGETVPLGTVTGRSFFWADVSPANYVFVVQPLGLNGLLGASSFTQFNMIQASGETADIETLVLSSAGVIASDGTFQPSIQVAWDEVTIRPITHYLVEWKYGSELTFSTAQIETNTFKIPNPVAGQTYTVQVTAVAGAQIVQGPTSDSIACATISVLPATPTGWAGTAGYDMITLAGSKHPALDFAAFKIYGSTAASTALVLLDTITSTRYVRKITAANTYTRYRVSAVNRLGVESARTSYISVLPVGIVAADIDTRGLNILDTLGNEVFGSDGHIGTSAYVTVDGSNIQLSEMAANSLVPTLNFVGTFASAPNSTTLGTSWKQNAVYKNSTDGKSYILTGAPLAWMVYLEDGKLFSLIIESSNGTAFKPGQGQNTLLKARVFKNGAEVTAETSDSWFRWRRVSIIPLASPNDDATWNSLYYSGYKQVAISVDSVNSRATFFCDIISS